MKEKYDFSKGVRGKFSDPDAIFLIPVYLDPAVQERLTLEADRMGQSVDQLATELLDRELQILSAAK